jgi:succinyl-CoA synthetase beta subunit/malate-CoA ligase subunit beta
MSDDKVRAVLVNIFAGINRCDWVAQGIVQALEKDPTDVPIVVRLSGRHVEEGRKILLRSGFPIVHASTLAEAATRVVTAAASANKARSSGKVQIQ